MEHEEIKPKQQISTPIAIIVAGFLIMVGILLSKNGIPISKTLSEQVGVSKEELNKCIQETDLEALSKSIDESVDKAMSHIPKDNGRGTPYSIVVGPNGFITEIRGAETYENVKKIIDSAALGKLATETSISGSASSDGPATTNITNLSEIYKGNITLTEPNDHMLGNADAKVTIIEYSDFECPYCKQFHPVLKQIVEESNGTVKWIYRHYPLHQHSFEKLVAAECVAKMKGHDAFWKYSDLLFGLLKTAQDPISDQL